MSDQNNKPGNNEPANGISGAFTVEFGDLHGRQQSVQTLRATYRGFWSVTNLHRRKDPEGKTIGGRPVGDAMSQMPDTPGIRMAIDLSTGQVREYDPLETNPELLAQVCRVMGRARGGAEVKMTPWPKKTRKLDEHTLKTLCRELRAMVTAEYPKAILVDGKLPTDDEIKAMPGRFLFDPANSDPAKFRFQDEYDKWLVNRRQVGAA